MKLSSSQIGEFKAREFLGDETWKKWIQDYEQCMAFRKTIKGKPTEEQRIQIELNAHFIDFYKQVLFTNYNKRKTQQ